jgi:hypothetical protein
MGLTSLKVQKPSEAVALEMQQCQVPELLEFYVGIPFCNHQLEHLTGLPYPDGQQDQCS